MLILHTKAAVWGYDLSVEQYKNESFTLPTFDIYLVNNADNKETYIFQLANYALNFKDGWKDFRYNSTFKSKLQKIMKRVKVKVSIFRMHEL